MNNRKFKTILPITVAVLIALIFIHSMLPQSKSMVESEWVRSFVKKLFFGREFQMIDYLHIRKTAHFVEYFILGVFSARLYTVFNKKYSFVNLYSLLTSSLLVGLLDETLQLFTNRTSQIKDVWLDFSGSLCGIIIFFALYAIIKNRSRK